MDARARAKAAAGKRGTTAGKGTVATGGNNADKFAFFSEDANGLKISPKTVLIFALFFIGSVVVLHILGKVKSATVG